MCCTYHMSNGVEYSVDPRSMSGGRYLSHTYIQLTLLTTTVLQQAYKQNKYQSKFTVKGDCFCTWPIFHTPKTVSAEIVVAIQCTASNRKWLNFNK